jgi:hypothetical protein
MSGVWTQFGRALAAVPWEWGGGESLWLKTSIRDTLHLYIYIYVQDTPPPSLQERNETSELF